MPLQKSSAVESNGVGAVLVLAVDIGTTATKAVVVNEQGWVLHKVQQITDAAGGLTGNSQQDPETVMRSVLSVLATIFQDPRYGARIESVVFSSQMYSILAVDARNRPLGPSFTWADDSAQTTVKHWQSGEADFKGLTASTGCPVQALYPLAKIARLRTLPEYAGVARFVSIKEYVLFRLTGEWVVDWQMASASGLLSIRSYTWCDQALQLAGISAAQLSDLVSVRHRLGPWTAEALSTGLRAGIPGIVGGGDGPLGSLGLCAFSPHSLAVNVGTSAAARVLVEQPVVDETGGLWTYTVDRNLWVMGGLVSSAGAVFDKVVGLLGGPQDPGAALASAEGVAAGAGGLLFIPALGGIKSPSWQADASGTLHGWTFAHERPHIIRSLVEGLVRMLCEVIDRLRDCVSQPFAEIRAAGGLSAAQVWRSVTADMSGLPVRTYASPEASARGAALLALIALGVRNGLQDFSDWNEQPAASAEPDPVNGQTYELQRLRTGQLFTALQSHV